MNRYEIIILLSLVFSFFWAGCNDDEKGYGEGPDTPGDVKATLRMLNNQAINRFGGRFYWAVKADAAWELDEMEIPEWLTLDPVKGKAGTTAVIVKVDTLFTDEAREALLPFHLEGMEEAVNITIQQTVEGEFTESIICRFLDDEIFGIEGGVLTKTLETSEAWTLSENCEWLTVAIQNGGAGETAVSMEATASSGDIRVAVLNFHIGDTILELAVMQGLNQNHPILTLTEEAAIVGNQATVTSHCKFINDRLEIEEVGFAFRPKAIADAWEHVATELTATAGEFDFSATVTLKWGTEYVYKPYAKLNGETIYGAEEGVFTTGSRTIEGGVWYYENFDGMYNPETKEYAQAAVTLRYNYNGQNAAFDTDGGYLRQAQPTAVYNFSDFRMNVNSDGNFGIISAIIHPEDISYTWWDYPKWAPEGMQFYEGASGNWKAASYYKSNWSCTISKLDFAGAPALQLTFGCYSSNKSLTLPASAKLKVEVSANGTDWNELPYDYGSITDEKEKRWRHIIVDNFPNTMVALRISLDDSGLVYAIDDIKVMEKN